MKKIWISVCIFAVIAFSFTGVLIHLNNAKISKENKNDELNNGEEVYEDNHTNDYKLATTEEITLDYYRTYNENSIVFEDISLPDISEGNIFQIKGLKDEKVQDRINKDIKNKVNIKIADISKEENFKSFNSIDYDIKANFSNVISAEVNIEYMQKDDSKKNQHVYLNYELVNGNRLKLNDLFAKNIVLTDIARKYLYEKEMDYYEDFEYDDIYYDIKNDVWLKKGDTRRYDNVPEQKINKEILKFEKMSQENEFSFSDFSVDISMVYISFYTYNDQVTIYDKYLTSESIYADDTVGKKGLFPFVWYYKNENKFGFLTDNFYYDIAETDIRTFTYDDNNIYDGSIEYNIYDNLKKADDGCVKWCFNEIEKCKEIALKDKSNFYAIISTSRAFPQDYCSRGIDGFYYKVSNTFNIEMGLYKIVVPIERKNEVIKAIRDAYKNGYCGDLIWDRYMELVMDPEPNAYSDKLIELSTEHLVFLSGLYDVRTLQPVESITEHDEEDFNVVYVLPGSDKVKIAKSDIENFSLDELNKAYNEIFARHGHDFTNKELKNFFWGMIWYTPISGKTVSLDELNEVEKYNLNIIKEVIAEKKK